MFAGTFNGNNHTIDNINMVCTDNLTASFFPQLNSATIKDLTLKDVTINTDYARCIGGFTTFTLGGGITISNCHLDGTSLLKAKDSITRTIWIGGFIATCQDRGDNVIFENCSVGEDVIVQGQDSQNAGIQYSGGFVGLIDHNTNILFENCTNYASVYGSGGSDPRVGGFAGYYDKGGEAKFLNCKNYGDIIYNPSNNTKTIDSGHFAGILGGSNFGIERYSNADEACVVVFDRCANFGNINLSYKSSAGCVGGLIGMTSSVRMKNCYNTGNITVTPNASSSSGLSNCIGGLIGLVQTYNKDNETNKNLYVKNCYNTGDIGVQTAHITQYIGGVIGFLNTSGAIDTMEFQNAYSMGKITVPDNPNTGDVLGSVIDICTIDHIYYETQSQHGIVGTLRENVSANGGYYTTTEKSGEIIPVRVDYDSYLTVTETLSEKTDINLLSILNDWVENANSESSENTYLTWKMTNPASEDGSKVSTVHPMFGVEELKTLKFHVNQPDVTEDKLFRVYNAEKPAEFAKITEDGAAHSFNNKGGVDEFYNIPKFAKDGYVFAGWYTVANNDDNDKSKAFEFNTAVPSDVEDVYAHWIPVGKVDKDDDDDKELPSSMNGKYKGFEMFGVQIRPKKNYDYNYEEEKEGGLRFVASISESLLSKINAVHTDNKIEYGFVSASEDMVKAVVNKSYMNIDKDSYTLQYKGKNVNGVDTLLDNATKEQRKCPNNFRYITNVDCTSQKGGYGSDPNIKLDHRNFTNYRLASYVVTYKDDESGVNKGKNVAARAYLRYTDANGLLRTFYNDYGGTKFYGGCSTNYTDVEKMATNTKTVKN